MVMPGGAWVYAQHPVFGFSLSSAGFSPITGGAGTFTSSVLPVPEPSSLAPLAFGAAVIFGVRSARRQ